MKLHLFGLALLLAACASAASAFEFVKLDVPTLPGAILAETVGNGAVQPVTLGVTLKNDAPTPVRVTVTGAFTTNDIGVIATPAATYDVPAKSTVTVRYAPTGAYGWFKLVAITARAGTEQYTQTHGVLCILRPAAQGVRPDSMFGLVIGENDENIAIARAMGVKWKCEIPGTDPDEVNPAPGKYWGPEQINVAKRAVQRLKDAGILCLGYVNYNMSWNVQPIPGRERFGKHENRPRDLEAQAEMVYQMIKPLAADVKHWELWNEPWIHEWTWATGTAQDYRDMTKLIWGKVKKDFPDVQLVGGGSNAYQRDVVFAKGSKDVGYMDGAVNHPYGVPDRSFPCVAALDAYELSHWAKGPGKGGIWMTECGTMENYFPEVDADEQRNMVARCIAPIYMLNKLGAGETPIKLFAFASMYNEGFSGQEYNWWDGETPKPVVSAFAAMTHFVEDGTLVGDIYAASKAAWAIHYTKPDGGSVVTFWPEHGLRGEMILPDAGFQIYDYQGRAIGTKKGGAWHFPIQTWEMRYVVSKASPEAVKQAFLNAKFVGLPALEINPRSFTAPLDRKPALRLKVENLLPQTTDAVVTVEAPAGFTLAKTRAELKALKPGEIRFIDFPVTAATPNAANRYVVKFRGEAGGIAQDGTQVVQVACATYGTPTVDGNLAEWGDAVPVTMLSRGGTKYLEIAMNPNRAAEAMRTPGAGDTAIYKLMTKWDANNVYIAAEIPDDSPSSNPPFPEDEYAFIFRTDSLQLAFDCLARNPDDILYGHPLYEKAMAADVDYEFGATLTRKGTGELQRLKAPGTNYQTWYPTNAPSTPPLGAMAEGQIRVTRADGMLRYEMAIPWSAVAELGQQVNALKPGGATTTHFAFAVNDDRGRGTTYWTQEAGEVQSGSYGFSPHWGGGQRAGGGRIITDWGFCR